MGEEATLYRSCLTLLFIARCSLMFPAVDQSIGPRQRHARYNGCRALRQIFLPKIRAQAKSIRETTEIATMKRKWAHLSNAKGRRSPRRNVLKTDKTIATEVECGPGAFTPQPNGGLHKVWNPSWVRADLLIPAPASDAVACPSETKDKE